MTFSKRKILLIDDHEIIRAGLSAIIAMNPDLEVVDQQPNAELGLQSITHHRPDVVIIDIHMPGASPFEMTTAALQILPNLKIIFLTAFATDSNLERALQAGACGFVTKSESMLTVVTAIREVLDNRVPFFSNDVRHRVVSSPRMTRAIGTHDPSSGFLARKSLLSPREQEILCWVAKGQSAKQIAQTLTISAKTVERHKSNIMTKLHLHTQVDLTRYAIREGMIAP